MSTKSTKELENILESTHPKKMQSFLSENKSSMAGDKAFYYYMKDLLMDKGILLKDLYIHAGVSESYGGKILSMEKHTTNRDVILKFCIAGHFTKTETNRALKLYGFSELYSKDPRDACIIVALNNEDYDLAIVDEMLKENGLTGILSDAS